MSTPGDAAVRDHPGEAAVHERLGEALAAGEAHVRRSLAASERFFEAEAEAVSAACRAMAGRFARSGRLFAVGTRAAASDAYHVSVEFVHPVIVGKRALPALALTEDPASRLALLARPDDIALGLVHEGEDPAVAAALDRAGELGLLTLLMAGGEGPGVRADHSLVVREDDPTVVQEVQETCYHVLWELVHVFLDHEGGR